MQRFASYRTSANRLRRPDITLLGAFDTDIPRTLDGVIRGVVVVRTETAQRGATGRFLLGLYSGLAAAPVPAVGVESTDAAQSATKAFERGGLSTVDDVDKPVGRLATVLLLAGASSGQYGVKDTADDVLPPFPLRAATGG